MKIDELTTSQMNLLVHLKYKGEWKPFYNGRMTVILNGMVMFEQTFKSLVKRGLIEETNKWLKLDYVVKLTSRADALMQDEERVVFEVWDIADELPSEVTFNDYANDIVPVDSQPLVGRLQKLIITLMHEVSELGFVVNASTNNNRTLTDASRTQIALALGEALLYVYVIATQIGVSVKFIEASKIEENTNE